LLPIRNINCSSEFSRLNFEPSNYTKNGKEYPKFYITRDGFSILAMGFTGKKAMEWKEKYIGAFNVMEKQLLQIQLNNSDPQWFEQRQQSKAIRHDTTDVFQQFIEYAKDQGSKNADYYFKHLTNVTYKSLGMLVNKRPKLRDTLDGLHLSWLMTAESIAQHALLKYMGQRMHYKDIYKQVSKDIIKWAEPLLMIDGNFK